jgi:cystathionine beta-lyase family protein involved in aluminum resistance
MFGRQKGDSTRKQENLQKNYKKLQKKLQKNYKKITKKLQKNYKKIQKIYKILQKNYKIKQENLHKAKGPGFDPPAGLPNFSTKTGKIYQMTTNCTEWP